MGSSICKVQFALMTRWILNKDLAVAEAFTELWQHTNHTRGRVYSTYASFWPFLPPSPRTVIKKKHPAPFLSERVSWVAVSCSIKFELIGSSPACLYSIPNWESGNFSPFSAYHFITMAWPSSPWLLTHFVHSPQIDFTWNTNFLVKIVKLMFLNVEK